MFTLSSLKRFTLVTGVATTMSLGGLAIAPTAEALSFGGATWTTTGNVIPLPPGQVNLLTGLGSTDALSTTAYQDFLGIASSALDGIPTSFDSITRGSAIKLTVNAGDTIRFNWSFLTEDLVEPDFAFVILPGSVAEGLTGSTGTFTQTFATGGLFAIGVVDVNDVDDNDDDESSTLSTLTLSNGRFTPIPTPALLPGLVGLGIAAVRKRKGAAAAE